MDNKLGKKGVLFDFGGTLLEYKREEVLRAILEEKDVELSTATIAQAYDSVEPEWARLFTAQTDDVRLGEAGLKELDRMLLRNLHLDARLEELADYVAENWSRVDQELPPNLVRRRYSDVLPCLQQVRDLGLKIGIVSNIPSQHQLRNELEQLELLEYFPVLVASGSVGYAKPAKEIFDIAANLAKLKPEAILFVGDDLERDYHGSLNAGMEAALIDRTRKHLDVAVGHISSLEEIPELVE